MRVGPDGIDLDRWTATACSWTANAWTPGDGRIPFLPLPENEWREELLKMKAGGIDIVSTYVFWIHHEEIEGQFDWSGSRNLRKFIQTCQDVGLQGGGALRPVGPWRSSQWRADRTGVLRKGWKIRSDDFQLPRQPSRSFMARLPGSLMDCSGRMAARSSAFNSRTNTEGAEHLLTLKRIGREAGLDAPLYTRTGWDKPMGQVPFGELVPLYGVYAEGFWDRVLSPMPAGYWKGFRFSHFRMDDATSPHLPGDGGAVDPSDATHYPYLTCEIGGGMMNSYHRRILVDPKDSESTTLIKLGSGSTLPGYYMYHGGVNPEGRLSTLMESQATGYWNDMPVKNYDFQAPLGQYGQIREQYHLLRRLHLFLHEWGSQLADMPATMPNQVPQGSNDMDTLRWSVRSDGQSGFVFVNNYQRLADMPPKKEVQFTINLPSGPLIFPRASVTIPSGACLIWPFNLDLGPGVRLYWATAQPLTAVDDAHTRTVFFAAADGIPARFAFNPNGAPVELPTGTDVATKMQMPDGRMLQIVVLDQKASLDVWKGNLQGRDRIFLTHAGLILDGDNLRLTATNPADLNVAICPAPSDLRSRGISLEAATDGVFRQYFPPTPPTVNYKAEVEQAQAAGLAREIPLGKIEQPVRPPPWIQISKKRQFGESNFLPILTLERIPLFDLTTLATSPA